jgi:hypothetical protein
MAWSSRTRPTVRYGTDPGSAEVVDNGDGSSVQGGSVSGVSCTERSALLVLAPLGLAGVLAFMDD